MWKLDGFPTAMAIVYVHMWEKYNYIGDMITVRSESSDSDDKKDEFKEKSKKGNSKSKDKPQM